MSGNPAADKPCYVAQACQAGEAEDALASFWQLTRVVTSAKHTARYLQFHLPPS